ncbi:hypothetical protein RHS01_01308 [Rhizoctonia solani]|uniref:Uncharacterized protein n=1 Tax=Rhizoctonia solani TaxID=456999 RepID=A0A8H7M8Y6_9AGAM|nr:hypothetical protein RHS01_01308 [Rhizoctonia solani]
MDPLKTTNNLAQTGNSVGSLILLPDYTYSDFHNSYQLPLRQIVARQLPTPASDCHHFIASQEHAAGKDLSSGRSDCLESLLSLAHPGDQSYQQNVRMPRSTGRMRMLPGLEDNGSEDLDNLGNVYNVLASSLPLDRTVESNGLPFILQARRQLFLYVILRDLIFTDARWMSHFLFESVRIAHLAKDYIIENYKSGEVSRRKMNLLASNAYAITGSTEYDLANVPSFFMIQSCVLITLAEAASRVQASRELDEQYALEAMQNTYEYYATFDIILGVLTCRPTFFRYDVEFTPQAPETLFTLENGPGLRWLYGIPNRLIFTFAKMSALLEDFGPCIGTEIVDKLEREIRDIVPIIVPSTEPAIAIGQMAVQECWCLAALIYLYMGLCGSRTFDSQVTKARRQFLKILAQVRPRRSPDVFLIFPLVILGVATHDLKEQDIIRRRMLGVPECVRLGTMGNDFIRVLDSVWQTPRQGVWSDLRRACWQVLGV